MINHLQDCYRLLDVEVGAPREEVKRAYRELVRVWHPDRFAHDPALQQKAQEKLKQINLAYERICNNGVEEPRCGTASAQSNPARAAENTESSGQASSRSAGQQQEAQRDSRPPQPLPTNRARRFAQFAVAVVVITILKAIFSTNEHTYNRNIATSLPYAQPGLTDPISQLPAAQTKPESKDDPVVTEHNKMEFPVAETQEPNSITTSRDFFTVGSTKDEVLASQGSPDSFTDSSFTYGASSVLFEGNKVKSWRNSYPPLKVKMLPASNLEVRPYFTVGSTKDEVLASQGTPDSFTDSSFTYGASSVLFESNKVKSWRNSYPPLKVKMLPASNLEAQPYFTVGSTKDEVLASQGTPDSFTDSSFTYGASSVLFEGNKVKSWRNSYPPLKAKLLVSPSP